MVTKVQFNVLVKELGLSEAIKLVRAKLGKKYSNLHIRFDANGELLLNKVAKDKGSKVYKENLKVQRKARRLKKKLCRTNSVKNKGTDYL
jgi:predicted negative regulator of RcsB-dependent stress response